MAHSASCELLYLPNWWMEGREGMKETYTLSLCSCCMLVHAYGECCEHDHEYTPLSKIYDEYIAMLGSESSFSRTPCDGCGTPYAGERYDFVGWIN